MDSDEEDDEIATPAFNVDKLKAETKTPFRTVSAAAVSANISRVLSAAKATHPPISPFWQGCRTQPRYSEVGSAWLGCKPLPLPTRYLKLVDG